MLAAALPPAGCAGAATPVAPVGPFHERGVDAVATAPPPESEGLLAVATPTADAPAGAADDRAEASPESEGASEASLRRQLANDSDPTEAALELAALLCERERVGDALPVLDAALARKASPLLRVARAGVLRDLGQRHLARSELQAVRLERGAENLHPSLLFELAELQWLEGDGIGAAATLREISTVHGADEWTAARRREREALAAEIERGGLPSQMRVRDLLGNLRGAPLATERLAVLQQLWTAAGVSEATRTALRERAVAIALGDSAPAVRAKAVQLAAPAPADNALFVREALADEAPLVRQAAAARCCALLGPPGQAVLVEFLAKEKDAGTFLAMHQALAAAANVVDPVLLATAADADGRAAVVARWRERVRP